MSKKKIEPYLFLLPATFLVLFIFLVPFVYSIVIAMTDWDGISKDIQFVGLQNFLDLFKEKEILEVLKNNFIYFIEIVVIQNSAAIFLAALLKDGFRGRNFFRAALFFPSVICTVAVGFIWKMILDPISGYIPAFFAALHLDKLASVIWLGNTDTAIHTISFVNLWQWVGQAMIIYLAGMLSIDDSLYEAAGLDGAGRWMKFKKITLPLLAPAVTINIITSTIGTLKIYDLPFTMTGGGPGHATESLAITIYSNTFIYNKMGYGTAISLILFLFVLIVSIFQLRIMRRREDQVL
ncbi:MAG: sugar ABC transporter permease [Lachnospiraceae bacterium]